MFNHINHLAVYFFKYSIHNFYFCGTSGSRTLTSGFSDQRDAPCLHQSPLLARVVGIEPTRRGFGDLTDTLSVTRIYCTPSEIRTPTEHLRTMLYFQLYERGILYTWEDSNSHPLDSYSSARPIELQVYSIPGGSRTLSLRGLNPLCLPVSPQGHGVYGGNRTHGTRNHNPTLYLLSYIHSPVYWIRTNLESDMSQSCSPRTYGFIAESRGVEPHTLEVHLA